MFERFMHDQLKDYLAKILSECQCRFRQGLLAMTEKLRKGFARINPINKKNNKCFQYAVTVALNHEEKG